MHASYIIAAYVWICDPFTLPHSPSICVLDTESGSSIVGCTEIRNSNGAAIRVFYPAGDTPPSGARQATLFRNHLAFFIEGYTHVFLGSFLPYFVLKVIDFFMSKVAWLHPHAWTKLPRCYVDVQPVLIDGGKLPLVVWSHGLTGTGCEHGMLAVALALRGNVVALVHHSDGSSSLADIKTQDSSSVVKLRYQQPAYRPTYDKGFRQRQAEFRASEVVQARSLVLAMPSLKSLIDCSRVVIGGFSFGAATAGVVSAENSHAFVGAVLIDGWWHIELKKQGISQDLPQQVHDQGIDIPALFIGSSQFQGYVALNNATERVQAKCPLREVHVLPRTTHGNFMDAIWWLPVALTNRIGFSGKCHPHETYAYFITLVADFVAKCTHRNREGPGELPPPF